MGGVEVALLGTDDAGRRTGVDARPHEAEIRCRLPRNDARGGVARVGTVEAESNVANHRLDAATATERPVMVRL
jgi:hypothetical protein